MLEAQEATRFCMDSVTVGPSSAPRPPSGLSTATQGHPNQAELEVAKLATPHERLFKTPSGDVIGKLARVRVSDLSTDARFKVRAIEKKFFRPGLRQQYLEILCEGGRFPPLVVWRARKRLIVLAGHHRLEAYRSRQQNYMGDQDWDKSLNGNPNGKSKSNPRDECEVYLVECSEQEAEHIARSENSTHGMPLTNEEKHAIFLKIRKDPYYDGCRSDRYFARMLGVTHGTIQNWRKQKQPRSKEPISAQKFYRLCLAISKRGVDCAAVHRELTSQQLKVIGQVEDFCHQARYGVRTTAAPRDVQPRTQSN